MTQTWRTVRVFISDTFRDMDTKRDLLEDAITALCHWCGQRFPVSQEIINIIRAITHTANLISDQSPCLELPVEAWEEPHLLSE